MDVLINSRLLKKITLVFVFDCVTGKPYAAKCPWNLTRFWRATKSESYL